MARFIIMIALLAALFIGVTLWLWEEAPSPREVACLEEGGRWMEGLGCAY